MMRWTSAITTRIRPSGVVSSLQTLVNIPSPLTAGDSGGYPGVLVCRKKSLRFTYTRGNVPQRRDESASTRANAFRHIGTMKIEYQDLSTESLLYRPCDVDAISGRCANDVITFLDSNRDSPELVGIVPNLREFATGVDHNVGAFEIKAQGSCVAGIPRNLEFLLPTTALIIDDLYATAGSEVADGCQVSLQFFRRNYQASERLLSIRFTGTPRKARW
jgi:hypothetical protein